MITFFAISQFIVSHDEKGGGGWNMDRKYEKNISNTMNRVEFKPTTIACWAKTLPLSYQSDDITLKGLTTFHRS